jgi:hypothetical protein
VSTSRKPRWRRGARPPVAHHAHALDGQQHRERLARKRSAKAKPSQHPGTTEPGVHVSLREGLVSEMRRHSRANTQAPRSPYRITHDATVPGLRRGFAWHALSFVYDRLRRRRGRRVGGGPGAADRGARAGVGVRHRDHRLQPLRDRGRHVHALRRARAERHGAVAGEVGADAGPGAPRLERAAERALGLDRIVRRDRARRGHLDDRALNVRARRIRRRRGREEMVGERREGHIHAGLLGEVQVVAAAAHDGLVAS